MEVVDEDYLMIITDQGIMIRQTVSRLNIIGRNTQGVRLAKLDNNTYISSAERVFKENPKEDEEHNDDQK